MKAHGFKNSLDKVFLKFNVGAINVIRDLGELHETSFPQPEYETPPI